jgi:hypothetical protein
MNWMDYRDNYNGFVPINDVSLMIYLYKKMVWIQMTEEEMVLLSGLYSAGLVSPDPSDEKKTYTLDEIRSKNKPMCSGVICPLSGKAYFRTPFFRMEEGVMVNIDL